MQSVNPILNFWLGSIFFIVLSFGLLIDIILFTIYWDKWPKLFKKNLNIVPWFFQDVLRICSGLILIYFAINLAGYLLLKFNPAVKVQIKPFINIVGGIGMYGFGIWFMLYFLKINYQSGLKNLGIKWTKWWSGSLKGIILYLGFIPILVLLTFIGLIFCNIFKISPEAHPLVDILKKEKSLFSVYYLIIIAVIIAPIFEEILFRGLFYQSLVKRLGLLKAAVISSICFSLLHFNTAQFLPIIGLGILFCFMFEYTGSLVPAIVLHILNNGFFLGLFFVLKEYI